jgi:hypothetical protein
MLSIPETIRQARLDANLSQMDLAAKAGTSQSALARYETGASLPTLPTLERLLAACGRCLEIKTPPTRPSKPVSSVRGRLGPQADKLRHQRRRLLDAAKRHGVGHLRAFGSLARGETRVDSDVDLLVDLKPGHTLVDLAAFRREAEEILDLPVDVATADMLKVRFRDEILSEALPL